MHMIPLGGTEAESAASPRAAPQNQGLRDLLGDDDLQLDIAQPALESNNNPAQASALDIDLDVAPAAQLPAWATRGGASARMSRVGPPARRPRSSSHGGLVALGLIVVALGLAALVVAFFR
jgi:hypothetical protein